MLSCLVLFQQLEYFTAVPSAASFVFRIPASGVSSWQDRILNKCSLCVHIYECKTLLLSERCPRIKPRPHPSALPIRRGQVAQLQCEADHGEAVVQVQAARRGRKQV